MKFTDIFNTFDEIYLVFTSKSKYLYKCLFLYCLFASKKQLGNIGPLMVHDTAVPLKYRQRSNIPLLIRKTDTFYLFYFKSQNITRRNVDNSTDDYNAGNITNKIRIKGFSTFIPLFQYENRPNYSVTRFISQESALKRFL